MSIPITQVSGTPRTLRLWPFLTAAAVAVGVAACQDRVQPVELGAKLHNPLYPQFQLTDTEGRTFDFAAESKGSVTLLFFGYTRCPDACPVHMANIAGALKKLPHRIASQVQVVFVTTDPDRDTPERIREWLDHFDTKFIGLTGTEEEIAAAGRQVKIAPAVKEPLENGDYLMGHSARVIAFTADGAGRYLYPFGTRQADWAAEIPALVSWRAE
jgi:protein SCO1/2